MFTNYPLYGQKKTMSKGFLHLTDCLCAVCCMIKFPNSTESRLKTVPEFLRTGTGCGKDSLTPCITTKRKYSKLYIGLVLCIFFINIHL